MLEQATIVIKETEVLLFGGARAGVPNFISNFFIGFYYIYIGFERFFYPIKKFSIVLIGLSVFSYLTIWLLGISSSNSQFFYIFSISIPIAMVVFARPHIYCFDLATSNQVAKLADIIQSSGIKKEYELNILKESIELAEVRVEKRSKHFYWILATYTAICVFIFNFYTRLAFSVDKPNLQTFFDALTLPVLLYLLVTPVFFICIFSYKKANDAVFQLIKLSICEVRHRLLKQNYNTSKRKQYKRVNTPN